MFSELQFSKFNCKNQSPGQIFLRAPNYADIFVQLFYYFDFERNYGVLQPKIIFFLLNKKPKLSKNKTEWKMENPTHAFRERNPVLQLI